VAGQEQEGIGAVRREGWHRYRQDRWGRRHTGEWQVVKAEGGGENVLHRQADRWWW